MSSDLIGGYLTFYLNQPIKWADFRLDALLADTMLTKLYTTGPMYSLVVCNGRKVNISEWMTLTDKIPKRTV
jgi:hypothetical protein